MQSQVLFGKYETVSHLCQKQQEEWISSQANPLCASKHSTFNLEISHWTNGWCANWQVMDRYLTAPEMKWKGTYRSNDANIICNENLEWILPLATVPGCKTSREIHWKAIWSPKVNNSDLILACSIGYGTTRNQFRMKSANIRRTNCVGFAKILNCSCVWCTKTWSQHNNRCKWSCSPEGGNNLWYQYMGCIVPILLATIWFSKQILPRTS